MHVRRKRKGESRARVQGRSLREEQSELQWEQQSQSGRKVGGELCVTGRVDHLGLLKAARKPEFLALNVDDHDELTRSGPCTGLEAYNFAAELWYVLIGYVKW